MNALHSKITASAVTGLALLLVLPAYSQPEEVGEKKSRREQRQERRAERRGAPEAGGQRVGGSNSGQGGGRQQNGGGQGRQPASPFTGSNLGGITEPRQPQQPRQIQKQTERKPQSNQARQGGGRRNDNPFSVSPAPSVEANQDKQGQRGRELKGRQERGQPDAGDALLRQQERAQKAAEESKRNRDQQERTRKAAEESKRNRDQQDREKVQQAPRNRQGKTQEQPTAKRNQVEDLKPSSQEVLSEGAQGGVEDSQGRRRGGASQSKAKRKAAEAEATPYVPSGTPPASELSKRQQNRLERQQRQDARQEQKQDKKEARQTERDLKQAERKGQLTPAAGTADAGEPDEAASTEAASQEGRGRGRLDKANRGAGRKQGQEQETATAEGETASPAQEGQDLSRRERRQVKKDAKEAAKAVQQSARELEKTRRRQERNPNQLTGAEQATLIGANTLSPRQARKISKAVLTAGDDLTYIKNLKIVNKKVVNNTVINQINQGILPVGYSRPWGDFGLVRQPAWGINLAVGSGFLLPPPPPVAHGAFDFHLSWNYWDGRSYYDHGYASSLFVSLGHVRYGGCDGAIVGGRYYSYGYGWIDGCVDYGQRRIWVPGFYAPYVVEECGNVPVWVPPVYEDVWTGCCWETVQVDGGYFAPSPYVDCRLVTRYTWVPGHFQYYWA